jgi:hypothetical protein
MNALPKQIDIEQALMNHKRAGLCHGCAIMLNNQLAYSDPPISYHSVVEVFTAIFSRDVQ